MSEMAASATAAQALPAAATEQVWLERQCRLLNARAGLVVLRLGDEYRPAAAWPHQSAAEALLELVERSFHDGAGLFGELDQAGLYGMAYPVRQGGAVVAVAAVAVPATSEAVLAPLLRQLEWGAAGLALLLERASASEAREQVARLTGSLEALAEVLSQPGHAAAALAFVTDLANRTGAERVSYGQWRRGRIWLLGISHNAQFGRKMNLVRLLEAAMEEACDQRATLAVPTADADAVPIHLAQVRLAQEESGQAVASIPLFQAGKPIAALTLERSAGRPFELAELGWLESLGSLAAAALEEKRRNDAALPVKAWVSLRAVLGRFLGRGHVEWKLAGLVVLALLLFASFATGTYRLAATATLTSRTQQAITAPFDGYVRTAPVRAGDQVPTNALLVQLDDRDLLLERLRLGGELARAEAQYQRAVAERDRARINILTAEREQYQAQVALVQQQIQRARIVAPFAGLVASGDLSQRLGSAVQKGEVLFAVAPTDEYRVDLQVRESRIADVVVGQRGTLFLSARPDRGLSFTVHRLTPRVVAEEGRSHFVVEALLDERPDAQLQPGLQGIGKVQIGTARFIAIWSRDLREWFRLLVWSWWA